MNRANTVVFIKPDFLIKLPNTRGKAIDIIFFTTV